ncbi:MAG: class I SAM-dependent methyltransferase [Candidatus Moranbacteria bacterium]|nr:class I SAM-dependent methyltransferase [Candidatus Moranbacteria bacterium]
MLLGNATIHKNYNSQNLVDMWGDLIDWKKRREGENGFLIDQLRKHNVRRVFDAALGDGCDSIYLLQKGFDVTSNEIDKTFLAKALQNAKANNVQLKITSLDWRELDKELEIESFDAVIILGNSLTYLFTKETRLKALEQFRRILKKSGILIIDERNCQNILDNRDEILKGNFNYSGKYVYCGEKVHGRPIEISDDKVKFEYTDERTNKIAYLAMYPWKRDELKKLLQEAGFELIEQYSDYLPKENPDADFYQYVCVK